MLELFTWYRTVLCQCETYVKTAVRYTAVRAELQHEWTSAARNWNDKVVSSTISYGMFCHFNVQCKINSTMFTNIFCYSDFSTRLHTQMPLPC